MIRKYYKIVFRNLCSRSINCDAQDQDQVSINLMLKIKIKINQPDAQDQDQSIPAQDQSNSDLDLYALGSITFGTNLLPNDIVLRKVVGKRTLEWTEKAKNAILSAQQQFNFPVNKKKFTCSQLTDPDFSLENLEYNFECPKVKDDDGNLTVINENNKDKNIEIELTSYQIISSEATLNKLENLIITRMSQ